MKNIKEDIFPINILSIKGGRLLLSKNDIAFNDELGPTDQASVVKNLSNSLINELQEKNTVELFKKQDDNYTILDPVAFITSYQLLEEEVDLYTLIDDSPIKCELVFFERQIHFTLKNRKIIVFDNYFKTILEFENCCLYNNCLIIMFKNKFIFFKIIQNADLVFDLVQKKIKRKVTIDRFYDLLKDLQIKEFVFDNSKESEPYLKRLHYSQQTFRIQTKIFFSIKGSDIYWAHNEANQKIISNGASFDRDTQFEENALFELRQLGFYESNGYWTLLPIRKDEVFHKLQEMGWELQLIEFEEVRKINIVQGKLLLDIKLTGSIFKITSKFMLDTEELSIFNILKQIDQSTSQISIGKNRVLELNDNILKILLVLKSKISKDKTHFEVPLFWANQIFKEQESQIELQTDSNSKRLLDSFNKFEKIEHVDVPKEFKGVLRDYQQTGLNWLAFLNQYNLGGILADDMGLGKTIQVISLLLYKKQLYGRKINLVVVPKSLLFNWQAEVERFAPSLAVFKYHGYNRMNNVEPDKIDIILTTYATLMNDIKILSAIEFDAIFLDESQAIKNYRSRTAVCVRQLHGRLKICMTGTPIENHLSELWSQLHFILPELVKSNNHLIDRFLDDPNSKNLQNIKQLIYPFILRRKKGDVAKDLPEKIEQVVYCEMTEKQKSLYEEVKAQTRDQLFTRFDNDGIEKSKIFIIEALLRLRQISCHTGLIKKINDGESGKLNVLLDMISEVYSENHNVLVFSQFVSMLTYIKNGLDNLQIPYLYLDGKINNREQLVNKFQSAKSASVFLISLKAGGVGLNLTAADYVFIFDPWWNPAVESQAIDRAHRIGQSKNVFAYRLISKDSVEEKIMKLKEKKQNLADQIINSDQSLISELSREDLEFIFS